MAASVRRHAGRMRCGIGRKGRKLGDDPLSAFPRSILIPLQDFALGGTERIAIRLANAWAREGRRVTIFCGEDEGALAELIDRAIVRVVEAPGRIARGRGSRRRLGKAATKYLRHSPADIAFIPGNYHWPAITPLAAMPADRRPRIVVQISAAVVKPQRRGARRLLYELRMRWLLRHSDAVVVLAGAALAEARRIAPGRVFRTIPLPALDDAAPAPTPAAGATIVAAGRLVPEKGFHDLIEAFAAVRRRDARLILVGAGPDAARLRSRVAGLDLADRVSFPGYVSDIRPFLDRSRLFVLASHYEGYAAVLVEALAAGRPVVATDCTPATGELLTDARFGTVVPIGDTVAMAAALEWMLASPPPDPALLAAKVARHRLTPVARDYIALFAGLEERR